VVVFPTSAEQDRTHAHETHPGSQYPRPLRSG
jgi:hypothetical protein